MPVIELQEHDFLSGTPDARFNNLALVTWDTYNPDRVGYYASFKIGAEWVDKDDAIVVTPKRGMENIDFLHMFMTCLSADLEPERFAEIYHIDLDKPAIRTTSLQGVLSPLIVFHYISLVSRIRSLKKGYVHHSENLKKIKGHINPLKNERKNIISRRYDRIYCEYDEYSEDIPENRLLKKALIFSERLLGQMSDSNAAVAAARQRLRVQMARFEQVGEDVMIREIGQVRAHKLFKEYKEAIELAKLILRRFDYSINKVALEEESVVPFWIDMSLLYEHYVYGLLYEAYGRRIDYQYHGDRGYPDFLYYDAASDFGAILDTKYIPKYDDESLELYVIRQLCGYARDLRILHRVGYKVKEADPVPDVPCVIIYPVEADAPANPFIGHPLADFCLHPEPHISRFYKIAVPLPTKQIHS